MHTDSPYYEFGEGTPPMLVRTHRKGLYVCPADVEEAWEMYPDEHDNPEFVELLEKARKGKLRARAGRPRRSNLNFLYDMFALFEVERLAALYRAAKRRGSAHFKRIDLDRRGLMGFVHERVARKLRLGTGPSLANTISQLNRGRYFK